MNLPVNALLLPTVRSYFKSWFSVFDAAVILAGFVVDVILSGLLEEVASLIVGLRFWRIFKIMEELGQGVQERLSEYTARIEELEAENEELKREVGRLKADPR